MVTHRFGIFFARLADINALLKQRSKDVFKLLHVALSFRHHFEHIVIRDVTLRAPKVEQMLQRLVGAHGRNGLGYLNFGGRRAQLRATLFVQVVIVLEFIFEFVVERCA